MSELIKIGIRVLPFLVIILVITFVIKSGKVKKENLYLRKPNSPKNFFLWCIGFLILITITEFSLYQFDLLKIGKWEDQFFPSVIKILGIVVLAPIAEELVFRGMILYKLKQFKINLHVAILIQAIIFLLLHSLSYENSFASNFGMIQIFFDAMLFAYAKEQTKSLYTPIVMHAMGNFIAVLEQFIL